MVCISYQVFVWSPSPAVQRCCIHRLEERLARDGCLDFMMQMYVLKHTSTSPLEQFSTNKTFYQIGHHVNINTSVDVYLNSRIIQFSLQLKEHDCVYYLCSFNLHYLPCNCGHTVGLLGRKKIFGHVKETFYFSIFNIFSI